MGVGKWEKIIQFLADVIRVADEGIPQRDLGDSWGQQVYC